MFYCFIAKLLNDYVSLCANITNTGQYDSAIDLKLMKSLNITHVLNATDDMNNVFPAHFVYMKVNLKDDGEQPTSKFFRSTSEFIESVEKAKGKVCTV